MTRKQFEELATRFAVYANQEVEYKAYEPWSNKVTTFKGTLHGIGLYDMRECVIVANAGHTHAIHYKKVNCPDNLK